MCAGEFDGLEFLAGPDVEKMNRFARGETLGQIFRLDLQCAIGCIAR